MLELALEVEPLITLAVALLGFQLVAAAWRIQREVQMEAEGEITWLPYCDWLNLVGIIVTTLIIFLTMSGVTGRPIVLLLGLTIIFIAGYPFTIAGHYMLYTERQTMCPRPHFPKQEKIALGVVLLLAFAFVQWNCAR